MMFGSLGNRTAGRFRTAEWRKNVARDCIPNLTRHFFVILPSWVYQPSCCVSSLLFMIDLDKTENTCVCFSIIKIEPNFRSLFYHDSIIKIFFSREQSTSYVHAKKKVKATKLWDFDKVFEKRFMASSREFALLFLGFFVPLFWPFYRLVRLFSIGRFMFSCNHGQR